MTSLAVPVTPRAPLAELFARQPTLARYGVALLALTALSMVLMIADPRELASGINVWVKPAKFFFSVAIYALTTAWFFGYVRPERRAAWPLHFVVAVILAAGSFELAYIAIEGALGQESHFNISTPFHTLMFALMGIGALLLVATSLPLAWEIARRPVEGISRDYAAAVVIGLLLTFLLGGGMGIAMSGHMSHAVGPEGGHFPIFGWNRIGGDLRIGHFLGIHAQQAIPILGALIAPFPANRRWLLLAAGTGGYVALTLGVFLQAMAGRPFL